jgi:arginine:pyruvate transaminase
MTFASISDRLKGLGSDKWLVHIEGAKRRARGDDVIMLSIGEPDFPTPRAIVDVAERQMRAGRTRYSTGRGEPAVIAALASRYSQRTGRRISADQITFLPGTQTALFATFMTLVEQGNDVLIPDPYYATYEGVIAATGAAIVPVPLDPDKGFHLDATALDRAATPASRALLLNTPSNPTGAVLSAKEIATIGEVCLRRNLWIVSDEVYADLVYDGAFASPFDDSRICDRTIVVSSLSKSHAMPGFRCGWAIGPREFSAAMLPLSETMLFGSQPFLEDATAFALTHSFEECREMREAYIRRARLLVDGLRNAPGISVHMPEGGMFIMADIRSTGLSGNDFAMGLLNEENVVTMPGESFGRSAHGHIRISLTAPESEIDEACKRIARYARRLVNARSLQTTS